MNKYHWVMVVVAVITAALPALAAGVPVIAPYVLALQHILPIVLGALGLGTSSVVESVNAKAVAVKMVAPAALLVAVMCLSGCAANPAVVPVTSANQAAVSSCQSIESARNSFVFGDIVVTAGAAAAGVVSAALPGSDVMAKTDIAIGAAGAAGLAGVLTVISAFESSNFADGQCQSLLGPLPPAPNFGAKHEGDAK